MFRNVVAALFGVRRPEADGVHPDVKDEADAARAKIARAQERFAAISKDELSAFARDLRRDRLRDRRP